MDLLDASGWLHTERPSTISTGGECCRFRVIQGPAERNPKDQDVIVDGFANDKTGGETGNASISSDG